MTKTAAALTVLGAFFSPLIGLIIVIGFAIFMDILAGRWAAGKEAEKQGIPKREFVTSRKTREGAVAKIIQYNLAILGVYLIDRFIVNDIFLAWAKIPQLEYLLTKIGTVFIVWIEYDSIDEKVYRVKGYRIKDKIKMFIGGVKKFVSSIVGIKNELNNNN